MGTHISLKLEEGLVVVVIPELWVRGKSLQKYLMHCHRLLECGQILPAEREGGREGWREGERGGGRERGVDGWREGRMFESRRDHLSLLNNTETHSYASSSCFILVYSSFVIDSSPAEQSEIDHKNRGRRKG